MMSRKPCIDSKPVCFQVSSAKNTDFHVELFDIHRMLHSSNSPFTKGWIDFLKFGDKGGDKIFFLEREGLD